jgi:hypothetical protein
VRLPDGGKSRAICRGLGISEQSQDRLRREYCGLKVTNAARLKSLMKENAQLTKAVSNLTLDTLISEGDDREKILSPSRRPGRRSPYCTTSMR